MTDAVKSGARPGEGKAEHREDSPTQTEAADEADLTLVEHRAFSLGRHLKHVMPATRGACGRLVRAAVSAGRHTGEQLRAAVFRAEWSSVRSPRAGGRHATATQTERPHRLRLRVPDLGTAMAEPGITEPDDLLLYLHDPHAAYLEHAATVLALQESSGPAWREWVRRGTAIIMLVLIGIVIGVLTSVLVMSVADWVSNTMVSVLRS